MWVAMRIGSAVRIDGAIRDHSCMLVGHARRLFVEIFDSTHQLWPETVRPHRLRGPVFLTSRVFLTLGERGLPFAGA